MSDGVSRDDLRAAVASGVLDEIQASKLMILSDQRQGYRANMIGDDEPFELFKGFAEIFVTVGLGLLMAGLLSLSALLGDVMIVPVVALIMSWVLALYFTKKRRMSLPSIALCVSFALSLTAVIVAFLYSDLTTPAPPPAVTPNCTKADLYLCSTDWKSNISPDFCNYAELSFALEGKQYAGLAKKFCPHACGECN